MSDAVALDLFIQDFVRNNRLLNQHLEWPLLINRRTIEGGPAVRVLEFESGGHNHLATMTYMILPDRDTLRIELIRAIPIVTEHRFDYLRMLTTNTHITIETRLLGPNMVVSLRTRHRGLLNVDFIIQSEVTTLTEPLFCGL